MSSLLIEMFWCVAAVWGILLLFPLVKEAYHVAMREIKGKVRIGK